MRLFYATLIFLALGGVTLSSKLALSPQEQGFLSLRDRRFTTANNALEQAHENGDSSADTLFAYIESSLAIGDTTRAAALLEEAHSLYPKDLRFFEVARPFYKSMLQFATLGAWLDDVPAIPGLERARLATARASHDRENELNELRKLFNQKEATPQEIQRLALLEAQHQEYRSSVTCIEYLGENFPKLFSAELLQLEKSAVCNMHDEHAQEYFGKVLKRIQWFAEIAPSNIRFSISEAIAFLALDSPESAQRILEAERQGLLTISNDLLKRVAFAALNDWKKKDLAESVSLRLARRASPDSTEVNNLLYLWGPRPGEKERLWIADRFITAPPEERGKWMRILSRVGGIATLADAIQTGSLTLNSPERLTYQEMLVAARDAKKLHDSFQQILSSSSDPKLLMTSADQALALSQYDDTLSLLKRVIALEPTSPVASIRFGVLAFQKQKYQEAEESLERVFNSPRAKEFSFVGVPKESLIEGIYILGILKDRQARQSEAKTLYLQSLSLLSRVEDQQRDMRIIHADLLIRTGQMEKVIAIFEPYKETMSSRERALLAQAYLHEGQREPAHQILFSQEKVR